MSRKANPAVIGAFVVGGIALLVAAIVVLASGRFFRHTRHVVVYFPQSVDGLRVGAPVKFKGIEIGTVRDIRINLSRLRQRPDVVRIPVVLELDQERLSAEGALADLDAPETLPELVREGLRAELGTASLLTGLRHVSLDMKPGTPAELVADPSVAYPEIPALPSRVEDLPEKLSEVVEEIARVDFEGLAQSIREVSDGARTLVTSPELLRAVKRLDQVTAGLNAAMLDLRRTARELGPEGSIGRSLEAAARNTSTITAEGARTAVRVRGLLHPDGALLSELEETLIELNGAARALRAAGDQLSRDPGAILRGGTP